MKKLTRLTAGLVILAVLSGCFLRRKPVEEPIIDDAALEAQALADAPVEPPPAVEPPKLAKPKLWNIQISAELDPEIAYEKVDRLSENGVPASVQQTDIQGTTYYRVLVGPYRSKDSAGEDLERITNFEVSEEEPFLTTSEVN